MLKVAQAEADAVRNAGHADSEKELAALRAEVDVLTSKRDGIAGQLGALSNLMSGFGDKAKDEAPKAEPKAAKAAKVVEVEDEAVEAETASDEGDEHQ
jgi:hypothetical protein